MADPPWQQRKQRGAARVERRAPQNAADGEPLFGVVIWGVHPEHATSAAALRERAWANSVDLPAHAPITLHENRSVASRSNNSFGTWRAVVHLTSKEEVAAVRQQAWHARERLAWDIREHKHIDARRSDTGRGR